MTEVEVLTLERVVNIRGEEITVKPYPWATTFRMAKPLQTLFAAIHDNEKSINAITNAVEADEPAAAIKTLVDTFANAENIDAIIDAIATLVGVGVGKDKEYALTLDMGEMLALAVAVFGVNKDFFIQLAGKIKAIIPLPTPKKSAHTK